PVTIPNGGNLYLAWNYSVTTGTSGTNAQALAIDDVSILGVAAGPTNPSGAGLASPNAVQAGNSTVLTVAGTPGTNPPSTGLGVTVDLSSIGGFAAQTFFDHRPPGGHREPTAGDNYLTVTALGEPPTPPRRASI